MCVFLCAIPLCRLLAAGSRLCDGHRMDVETFRYSGTQQLTYTNHSPDTLSQVFYHLYFNAFQPESDMDIRSRTIKDPDPRVGDRISKLNDDEIGFLHVSDLEPVSYTHLTLPTKA